MIREKTAQALAAGWYAGQWSGLYKLACNQDHAVLQLDDWSQAIKELRQNIKNANPTERKELVKLVEYCAKKYYSLAGDNPETILTEYEIKQWFKV
jgi:flagellar biosynthesis/type III secretory pathway protein FliH